ncbi:hypothetical protein K3495_g10426 [Podosphaera aphanis]|nr:hypothetical protein K3495_g10426 [Podosphaera aphanis]
MLHWHLRRIRRVGGDRARRTDKLEFHASQTASRGAPNPGYACPIRISREGGIWAAATAASRPTTRDGGVHMAVAKDRSCGSRGRPSRYGEHDGPRIDLGGGRARIHCSPLVADTPQLAELAR